MSLPYTWHPMGAHTIKWRPEPGDLWPFEHAVYRVLSVRDNPKDPARPLAVTVRPVRLPTWQTAHNDDLHLAVPKHYMFELYPDEHYPVCGTCAEPLPCREQMAERVAEWSAARLERYSYAGICPACQEPVSERQKSLTWPDNLVLPGGPPLTFHLRRRCYTAAVEYERRWYAADPNARRMTLSCRGHVTNHNDGTYECTELLDCPGPTAAHPSYTVCRCPDCHASGSFDCHPPANAKNVYRGGAV